MSTLNRDAGIPVNLLPKIYYCSRTHSQLAQVVRELNKTIYRGCVIMDTSTDYISFRIKTTVLGSRDQLCIHDKVSKEENNRVKVGFDDISLIGTFPVNDVSIYGFQAHLSLLQ